MICAGTNSTETYRHWEMLNHFSYTRLKTIRPKVKNAMTQQNDHLGENMVPTIQDQMH